MWRYIADQPDTMVFDTAEEMKNYCLTELNFPQMYHMCAFCDLMEKNDTDCGDCPLTEICYNEYQPWKRGFRDHKGHVQDKAKNILNAIEKKYKEMINYE